MKQLYENCIEIMLDKRALDENNISLRTNHVISYIPEETIEKRNEEQQLALKWRQNCIKEKKVKKRSEAKIDTHTDCDIKYFNVIKHNCNETHEKQRKNNGTIICFQWILLIKIKKRKTKIC